MAKKDPVNTISAHFIKRGDPIQRKTADGGLYHQTAPEDGVLLNPYTRRSLYLRKSVLAQLKSFCSADRRKKNVVTFDCEEFPAELD